MELGEPSGSHGPLTEVCILLCAIESPNTIVGTLAVGVLGRGRTKWSECVGFHVFQSRGASKGRRNDFIVFAAKRFPLPVCLCLKLDGRGIEEDGSSCGIEVELCGDLGLGRTLVYGCVYVGFWYLKKRVAKT